MRLNLLGDEAKKEIKQKIMVLELINSAILLTVVVAMITVVMFGVKEYLGQRMSAIVGQGAYSTDDVRVESINKQMQQLSQIQGGYVKWSWILKEILTLVPERVKLNHLEFDKGAKQMTLSGVAETRNDYLQLETKLKESELLEKISAPVANLLRPNDVTFTLEASLKLPQ